MRFMEQWMYWTYLVFGYGSLIAGSLLLFTAVLFVIIWCLVQLHDALPAARSVELAMAVRLHGRRYVDRVFWKAVEERASESGFVARHILSVVRKHIPEDDIDEQIEGVRRAADKLMKDVSSS
jgi:hypothetical protein